ncbi:MAG TPA: rod shape-determining protein MreD [Novosphingobium sp.]|nr:rod shape-determining protein MreD [Novosphingobium sp.]HPB22153.1 rod shape-determining protein MreD [Novosphingobium sp.]HPZ47711.1 rod shape-determining protein MreD [Novosphingobium sp.]
MPLPLPLPKPIREIGRKRINRAPSPLLAVAVPWLVVMAGSLSPMWPVIASAPILPPIGFLMLVAWEQLRPGILPVWAGLPLGLFDDLYSGQPLGSAILLWSIAVILLDFVETRFPWRGFALNWLFASAVITAYLFLAQALAQPGGVGVPLAILPQLGISLLLYPLIARLVALFDRFRLMPVREA